MKLTKILALLMALMLVTVAFTACGNSNDNSTATPPADNQTTEPEGDDDGDTEDPGAPTEAIDMKVDVFIYNYADAYISSVRAAMADYYDAAGINATFHDGGNDQATQTEQINTALTQGTDLLVVNIVTTGSEDAAMNVIEAAKEKDVPVIFFNREVSDNVVNSYEKCIFVGTDADEAGYMQGEMIAEVLNADFSAYDLNGDGVISYIMFKGELGNAEANGRTEYSVFQANEDLAAAGNAELAYYDANNTDLYQPCNWDSAQAMQAMSTALSTNPFTGDSPIELVIANNDEMALGAIEALNDAGYNTGEGDFIPVFGVDATDNAQDAIAAGKMSGTIKQDAEGMAQAIVDLCAGVGRGGDLTDDLGSYNVDAEVNKVRIPYAKFTG